jgi:hypothetical protein
MFYTGKNLENDVWKQKCILTFLSLTSKNFKQVLLLIGLLLFLLRFVLPRIRRNNYNFLVFGFTFQSSLMLIAFLSIMSFFECFAHSNVRFL